MKFLLILSIVGFCLIIGKINQKKIKNAVFISLALIFTSTIFSIKIDKTTTIFFIISLIILVILNLIRNKKIQKIFFLFALVYFSLTVLFLSGVLNNRLEIDYPKLFIIDNSSFEIIERFQLNALYLPNILRHIVYNSSQIIFAVLIRTLDFLWINKLITYLGFAFFYLIYLALKKKNNRSYLIFPLLIIMAGILHRDPNNNLIYLFSIPPILVFLIKNINKLKISFLFALILINCLYSFL